MVNIDRADRICNLVCGTMLFGLAGGILFGVGLAVLTHPAIHHWVGAVFLLIGAVVLYAPIKWFVDKAFDIAEDD